MTVIGDQLFEHISREQFDAMNEQAGECWAVAVVHSDLTGKPVRVEQLDGGRFDVIHGEDRETLLKIRRL